MSLVGITGPILLSALLNCGLAGWTTSLTVDYYTRFPNDPKILRATVAVLFFLDLSYTWLTAWMPYSWLVVHYGDPSYIVGPEAFATYGGNDIVTGFVTLIVQAFFAWRIYILSSRNKIIPAIICVLGLLSCAFGVATAWTGWINKIIANFPKFNWGISIWLCSAAAADLLITCSMFFWLRSDGTHAETSFVVKRVLITSLETNLITAFVAIIDIGLFLGRPQDAWHILPNSILAKLYFISLLVSLNTRAAIASELRKIREATYGGQLSTFKSNNGVGTQVQVNIQTENTYTRDEDDKVRPNHVF